MKEKELKDISYRNRLIKLGAVLGIVGALAACSASAEKPTPSTHETTSVTTSPETEKTHEVDLIRGQTWKYMPGATQDNTGLHISHTGLAIRTLEETWKNPSVPEYISAPPQNTYGTHVHMAQPGGPIGFGVKISDLKGEAVLSFQDKPTYHYDERTYNHAGIDIAIENSILTANIWDEGKKAPTFAYKLALSGGASPHFNLVQNATGIVISSDEQKITIPGVKKFAAGEVWFGMNASDSWNLDSFNAYPVDKNELKPIDVSKIVFGNLSPTGLQAYVSKKRPDLVVGTAVDSASFFSDPYLAKLDTENFGGIVGEGFSKTQAWQPEKNRFVWNEFDEWLNYAKTHNKQLHGHTLIFGEAMPKWQEDELRNASPTEATALMKQDIQPIMQRGKGIIKTWDVINEPFDDENWDQLREHAWMKALGPSYIDQAFHIAHAADPNALLGINEWGLEADDDRWNAMIELVKGMKSRGVPIHYIGFQMHFDEDTLADKEVMDAILNGGQIEKRFKELEELGLKVRVSEISVAGAAQNLQAHVYAAALKACMNARNCIGFYVWGAGSNAAYFTSEPDSSGHIGPAQFGDDAPWQQNKNGTYSEKPAVAAMKAAAK